MGTVKYTGPVASFHCPTNAEIRSLKVHFSPKQEGSSDPSPENVRPIVGWDGVVVHKTGKNLFNRATIEDGYIYEDGSVVLDSGCSKHSALIPVFAGNTYVFSGYKTKSNFVANKCIHGYNENGIWVKQINYYSVPANTPSASYNVVFTIASNDNVKYVKLSFENNDSNIQLELGSTATSYEPYCSLTTNYEFGVLGKNKFNKSLATDNIRINKANGTDYAEGGYYVSSFIPVTTGATYTKNSPIIDVYHRFATYSSDNVSSFIRILDTSNSITIEPGEKYIRFCGIIEEKDTAQLELGSSPTTYEPYNPNHTIYGGWVDLITGEVCEEYIAKDMGQINWIRATAGGNKYYFSVSPSYPWQSGLTMYCSIYKFDGTNVGNNWYGDNYTIRYYYRSAGGNAREIYIHDERYDNPQDFKTAMEGINLVYKLNTPNTYNLAPTQLQTFLGQNNVWSNADYVEVEYDLHETQDILNRKNFIIANQPHIIRPAAASLQNFTTDVPAPLKECKVHFEPVQDLHGYDKPWPAGGGKNIAKPYDNSYISSTYISFDYSAANGTFRCYGTASASSTHSSPSATNAVNNGATFTLPADTYTLSIIDGDGTYIYAQCVSSTETVLAETTSHISFTTNETLTVFVRLKVAAEATVDNTVKIQLEKGSAATSYEPYENICPISGWNKLKLTKCEKNILDINAFTRVSIMTGNNISISDDIITLQWINGAVLGAAKDEIIPAGTYTISGTGTNLDHVLILTKTINGTTTNFRLGYSPKTFTRNQDFYFSIFGTYTAPGTATVRIQVEKGSVATEYEPYNGTTLSIDWTNSAGTVYGGYVDLVSGEVWAEWEMDDLSTLSWSTRYSGEVNKTLSTNLTNKYSVSKVDVPCICEQYNVINCVGGVVVLSSPDGNDCGVFWYGNTAYTTSSTIYVVIGKNDNPSGKIVYKLATPALLTTLTPTQLKTLRGTNNIWSIANGNIDLSYWSH